MIRAVSHQSQNQKWSRSWNCREPYVLGKIKNKGIVGIISSKRNWNWKGQKCWTMSGIENNLSGVCMGSQSECGKSNICLFDKFTHVYTCTNVMYCHNRAYLEQSLNNSFNFNKLSIIFCSVCCKLIFCAVASRKVFQVLQSPLLM